MDDLTLDQRLREAASYIDDDGFTARVVARLPAPRQQPVALRAPILLGLTLLSSVLAYVLSDGGQFVTAAMLRVAAMPPLVLLMLCCAAGAIVAAAGGVAAVAKTRQARL